MAQRLKSGKWGTWFLVFWILVLCLNVFIPYHRLPDLCFVGMTVLQE